MNEDEERVLYWEAVDRLREIIQSGNVSKEEVLEELDGDLE